MHWLAPGPAQVLQLASQPKPVQRLASGLGKVEVLHWHASGARPLAKEARSLQLKHELMSGPSHVFHVLWQLLETQFEESGFA